tara:strand:- start:133 stop:375 length:243 start_codon:yes stop_codon:yes gene_type:complete
VITVAAIACATGCSDILLKERTAACQLANWMQPAVRAWLVVVVVVVTAVHFHSVGDFDGKTCKSINLENDFFVYVTHPTH